MSEHNAIRQKQKQKYLTDLRVLLVDDTIIIKKTHLEEHEEFS